MGKERWKVKFFFDNPVTTSLEFENNEKPDLSKFVFDKTELINGPKNSSLINMKKVLLIRIEKLEEV